MVSVPNAVAPGAARLAPGPEPAALPTLRELLAHVAPERPPPLTAPKMDLRARLAGLLEEGRARGDLDPSLDPQPVATALVAVLQGGYVLARASGSADTCRQAVDGALGLHPSP